MKNNPLFSIIIPCYNVEAYVDQAIKSCLNQNAIENDNYEIIAIDDGSDDSTYHRLLEYSKHSNVTVITQTNSGLSATRNRGIDISRGKYILFLDGDDWLSHNALSILKQHINDADIIIFPMVYYWDSDHIINNSLGLKDKHIYNPDELLQNTIGRSQFQSCPAPTKCYNNKIFKENNQRFINGILHEDGPFYLETLHNVKTIKYIEEFLYHYRQQRTGSITTRKRTWENASGIFKGLDRVFSLYGYNNKDVNYYFLATAEMQIYQQYETESDAEKVVNYMSTYRYRRFILHLLFNFRFKYRTFILGLPLVFSPKFARKLYNLKH